MTPTFFRSACLAVAGTFTMVFIALCGPPFIADPDLLGAFGAGFVNPYASGYSIDVVFCWLLLLFWVVHDAQTHAVKHGWVCVLLGLIPGVAVGFALYFVVRQRQLQESLRAPASAKH